MNLPVSYGRAAADFAVIRRPCRQCRTQRPEGRAQCTPWQNRTAGLLRSRRRRNIIIKVVQNVLPKTQDIMAPIMSAAGKRIRTLYRKQSVGAVEAANTIKFSDEDLLNAMSILEEEYERAPSARIKEVIGEYYLNLGNTIVAESIFRDAFAEANSVHISNMLFANVGATIALVDDDKKILYVPIPKCGSSTIKNLFTFARFGKNYGEVVHYRHREMYRVVPFAEFATTYRDYYKFTVVRDPIERVLSYYAMNVRSHSLRREARGREMFMGLTTDPLPLQLLRGFQGYRQMFLDFRHHTDAIAGYVRGAIGQINVLHMKDISSVRSRIEDLYRVKIEDQRSMVTNVNKENLDLWRSRLEPLKDFYAEDYKLFF